MTPHSKHELLAAVRPRYQKATRSEKATILDESVATTGYHRGCAAINNRQTTPQAGFWPHRNGSGSVADALSKIGELV